MIILWLWKEINLSIFLWFFSSAKAGSGFFPVNFNSPAILIKTKAVFQRFSTSFPSRPTTTTSRMALSASRGMMRGLVARGRQFCTSRSSKAVVNPEVRKANFDRLVTHANMCCQSQFLSQNMSLEASNPEMIVLNVAWYEKIHTYSKFGAILSTMVNSSIFHFVYPSCDWRKKLKFTIVNEIAPNLE